MVPVIPRLNDWAIDGKDRWMEKGHALAVKEMINIIKSETLLLEKKFNFLDLGCGNGWVVRKFSNHKNCNIALGVDGAPAMIDKAKQFDQKGIYVNADIETWDSQDSFDIIFSMETFYYFKNLDKILNYIYSYMLKDNGI